MCIQMCAPALHTARYARTYVHTRMHMSVRACVRAAGEALSVGELRADVLQLGVVREARSLGAALGIAEALFKLGKLGLRKIA